MTFTKAHVARYALIAAAVITYWIGLKALVVDDNPIAAILAFWAVAWKFVYLHNQRQIERLRAERDSRTAVINLMATHMTDEQFEQFRAQTEAANTSVKSGS
ncbi:hypothetical protein ACWCSD_34495 [Nonomuraea sp. NPDC001684]